jgi:serine phosphatase RsbU (regulator of sigma subunit)
MGKGHITFLLFLCIIILPGLVYASDMEIQSERISISDLDQTHHIYYISDLWKFMPGDDLSWASPGYDDSNWSIVSTYLSEFDLAFTDWNGTGWFRVYIEVDSTLVNKPVALLTETHNGASEIYFNGNKLFEMGKFSTIPGEYQSVFERSPRIIVFPDESPQLLAVRYANFDADFFLDLKNYAGFRFQLGDAEYHLANHNDYDSSNQMLLLFFLGGLLVFTAIHALIFGFNRNETRNLFFSLFTLFLALMIIGLILVQIVRSPILSIYLINLSQICWLLAILLALRFVYSLHYTKTPGIYWLFILFGLIIVSVIWYNGNSISLLIEFFIFITIVEIIRVLILVFAQKEKGAWIIGIGMLFFAMGILYRVSVNVELFDGDPVTGSVLGSGLMILSMSVFLSRDFAMTQKRLGSKLEEVKILSARAIEQERINKKIEIESKLLEAEHSRKSKELEEARALQLSMLPKKLPDFRKLDVAVWMETATEVGGDYYDYHIDRNGNVTFVLGDATGHGLKAGIMVATAKSYFHTLAGNYDNLTILKKMSSGFRNLDLKLMFMGILLMKFEGEQAILTSAGMPPLLWYQKDNNTVKTLVQKGLPLGTKVNYNYQSASVHAKPGDILLLMSDGLMELFNNERQILGLDAIEQIVFHNSAKSAREIIDELKVLAEKWAGPNNNDDDITIMLIKIRES